ncbi:hypothetical protein KKB43_05230 [Patescibacteria group bacterium]|nr:hypothetical protein [Patescibacteria group bacterium]MBU4580388.1 hypothetical protein [Patescibacteria group bacterium]
MLKEKLLKARKKISFKNIKEFNFKKYTKLFSVLLILIIVGLVLPWNFAHAGTLEFIGNLPFVVIFAVFFVLFQIAHLIAIIGATVLNIILNPAIMNNVFGNPAIYGGWLIIRDICNLLFLLIMLLVAFGTIVQSSKYNIKNSLLKLILAIFLINFSNVIAGAIIDFGNILMYGILGWICPSTITCFSGFTGGLLTVVDRFANDYGIFESIGWNGIDAKQAIGLAIATVYTFMLGFIFLALAGFLLVRTAGLALLLILSPFAYFGEVMPGMEKISSKWWNNIWSYTLFGPIFALMLYISGEMAKITLDVPPFTDPNLGIYAPVLTTIISNILPLLFLLAIIPITKELGLAGTDVIMKNTTGLGQNIAKYAGGATDRWLARGAQDQRQGLRGRLNRARAYLSPGVAKRAWKSRTADQEHDYDMATGQTKDRMNWKRKGVESERDNIAENEAHRQFGEMNVKNTDEMVAKLAKAIEDKDGFLAAEIMRALAVNGDTNDALDRLSKSGDHTAADYNQFMNDSIKPLLGEEKTGKLSEDIGKSEEKDGTYIYGGHNEYDKKNDKYKMRDMFERDEKGNIKKDTSGKDIMNNNVVAKQVDFMLGRWDSKNEQNRMSNVSKTSFVDKNGNYTVQGAALLSQMGAPETVEKANRLKPKAAKAIYEGRQKPNSEAVFKNEIFTNEKTSKDLKLKDLQKIVGVNNKAEADKIYNKIEKNLKGPKKGENSKTKKGKGGGKKSGPTYGSSTAGMTVSTGGGEGEKMESAEKTKEDEEEESGSLPLQNPINTEKSGDYNSGSGRTVKDYDEQINQYREEIKKNWDQTPVHTKNSSLLFDLNEGFKGDVDKFIDSRKSFDKNSGMSEETSKHRLAEKLERMRDRIDNGIVEEEMDSIAKNLGLAGINVAPTGSIGVSIKEVGSGINKSKVNVDVDGKILKNLVKLRKVDPEFAKKAETEMLKHEREHLQGLARGSGKKQVAELDKMRSDEKAKGTSDEDIKMIELAINEKYYEGLGTRGQEMQAEIQKMTSAKDIDEFIEAQATENLGAFIAYQGIDELKKDTFNPKDAISDTHAAYIKEKHLEKIRERMMEMRQDLISKQAEKMKKDAEKGGGSGGGGTGAGSGGGAASGGAHWSEKEAKSPRNTGTKFAKNEFEIEEQEATNSLKESEEYFEEAFEEVKPYNPTLPNYYKDQSGSLGNFAANLKEEKADSETVNFVNKAVAKNRSAMANNLRQNDMAQLYDATPKSFGNKDMRERKEIDLKKYINKIKQGSFKFGDIEKRFPKVDEMIGKVGGSAGNMFGVEYEKAKSLYDFAKESKNPKERQAYLAMAEHTLDSIENGLGDKKTREILEKGLL